MSKSLRFGILLCGFLMSACRPWASDQEVSQDDVQLANQDPLPSHLHQGVIADRIVSEKSPDAVPEVVAESLFQQLQTWPHTGKELSDALLNCAAQATVRRLGEKAPCLDSYSGEADTKCLTRKKVGRRQLGQALAADRFDLNGDGILDYLISDRYYCNDLSANQSNVYFVMLSQANRDFRLAYADWASFGLEVVRRERDHRLFLREQAQKTYGIFTRFYQIENGVYVKRVCLLQDKNGNQFCPNSDSK